MDAFRLHRHVMQDYHDYATSFINIKDEQIDRFVREELSQIGQRSARPADLDEALAEQLDDMFMGMFETFRFEQATLMA